MPAEREELRLVANQVGAPTSAQVIAAIVAKMLSAAQGEPGRMLEERGGIANVACSGETSRHGFATAIVDGMRARVLEPKCQRIVPIRTGEFRPR